MKPNLVRLRNVVLVFAFVFIAGIAVIVYKAVLPLEKGGCQRETIAKIISPDGTWVAYTFEDICRDGAFVTYVLDTVHLARLVGTKTREGDVFAVDEGGDHTYRPVLQWLTPRLLQIVVPNKSSIGLSKEKFDDVTVQVKFKPDDPEERKRWLKEIERGSKSAPTSVTQ